MNAKTSQKPLYRTNRIYAKNAQSVQAVAYISTIFRSFLVPRAQGSGISAAAFARIAPLVTARVGHKAGGGRANILLPDAATRPEGARSSNRDPITVAKNTAQAFSRPSRPGLSGSEGRENAWAAKVGRN
jgi:hypothetical protein